MKTKKTNLTVIARNEWQCNNVLIKSFTEQKLRRIKLAWMPILFVMAIFTMTTLSLAGCENDDSGSTAPAVIDIADIPGVTAPAAGAAPVTAITPTAQYTGSVTWNGSPAKFAASTVYTAAITLTAKEGFTLQGVTANFFKITGAASTNAANSGIVTAVFPATGSTSGSNDNGTWVDPATQKTPLTGGTVLSSYTGGNKSLTGSQYGYETWDADQGKTSANKFTWYGANQGGSGAFKAEWTAYFLARLGYYWGNGGKYTQYKNIYIDYNFNRSNNASTYGGFIGVYGWSRNSSASQNNEKLIEYYIVDDWFYDVQLDLKQIGSNYSGVKYGEELGAFAVDGATYKIYKNPRINEASIDGTKTFTQIFSVRQGRRTCGTISVTEHYKAWSKYIELGNMYEAKFKVESFGGSGYLDLTYLYLSQESNRRNIPEGTTPINF
jgi:endo-1,4-beta-xylanase